MIVSGSLYDIKARYQRLRVVMADPVELSVHWEDGIESVRQEGG